MGTITNLSETRSKTKGNRRRVTKQGSVFNNLLKPESRNSQISFSQHFHQEMEKLRSPAHIVEQKSEDSVKNEDTISQGNIPDLNKRQMQAIDKLSIY